jgi:hypothetical protein
MGLLENRRQGALAAEVTGADLQRAAVAASAAAAGEPPTEKMWGLMYGSLIASLGLDPKRFQLIYPFSSWNWDSAPTGHLVSGEYDFYATVPQWSAVGAYQSAGTRLSDAYEKFLNALVVSADPVQKQKIKNQQNVVQDDQTAYDQQYKAARTAFEADKFAPKNFSDWLSDQNGPGYSYGKAMTAARLVLDKETDFLAELIAQSTDPNFKVAMNRLQDRQFWTLVDTNSLSNAIAAPGYNKERHYMDWVTAVQSGGGMSGSIAWTNSESSYDFSKTWAGGETSVSRGFFSLFVNGSWQRESWMSDSSELSVTLNFQAWEAVPIQDSGWLDLAFIIARANGEFRQGWNKGNFFGPKGSMSAIKTQMYVAYKPSFEITTGTKFTSEQQEKIKASGGVRIGPFVIGGEGGRESTIKNKKVTDSSFSGETDSELPFIFGVGIQVLGE